MRTSWLWILIPGAVVIVVTAIAVLIGGSIALPIWPGWTICEGEFVRADHRCPTPLLEVFTDPEGRPKVSPSMPYRLLQSGPPGSKEKMVIERYGLRINVPTYWISHRLPSKLRSQPSNSFAFVMFQLSTSSDGKPYSGPLDLQRSTALQMMLKSASPYLRSDWGLERQVGARDALLTQTTRITDAELAVLGLPINERPKTLEEVRASEMVPYFVPADDSFLAPDGSRLLISCYRVSPTFVTRCRSTFLIPNDRLASEIRDRLPPNRIAPKNNDWDGYGIDISFPRDVIGDWRKILSFVVCGMEALTEDMGWDDATRSRYGCSARDSAAARSAP